MKKGTMILIAILAIGGFLGLSLISTVISYSNKEKQLRNVIVNKQTDNKNEFDAMWKTIQQVAQVPEQKKQALIDIMVGYAQARTSGGSEDGSLMKWVQEAVPNTNGDLNIYDNVMNIIVSKRDGFVRRQKELLGLKTEHDNIIDTDPWGWVLRSFLGREKIEVKIVTSSKTEKSFETGVDDDIQVFPDKKTNESAKSDSGKVEK